jgi:pyruvate-ferredoxin/flavodoxin oxidoreductase
MTNTAIATERADHVQNTGSRTVVDGNEAAARIAHLASEVIAIYPITPASPMGRVRGRLERQGPHEPVGCCP